MNLQVERLRDRNLELKVELLRERDKATRLQAVIATIIAWVSISYIIVLALVIWLVLI